MSKETVRTADNEMDLQYNISCYKTLTIDYALYEQYLDDSDLTVDQKREFLDTLWNIIVNFVDLGFGVHPLQLVTKSVGDTPFCEQNTNPPEYLTQDSCNMIGSGDNPKADFKYAVDDENSSRRERNKP